jgi:hypothetical protein
MSNTLLSPTTITREALRVLHQKLNFIGTINRQYDDKFAKTGGKIGENLSIRMPNKYVVTDGAIMQVQDTAEETQTLTVATRKHVAMKFSDQDRTMKIDDFSKRYINPAMSVLAANVESTVITSVYKNIYNLVLPSTPTAVLTLDVMGDAHRKLADNLAPDGDWVANLMTRQTQDIIKDGRALFHSSTEIEKQYRKGIVGVTAGFEFYRNTLWPRHVQGAANGSYTTDTRTSALPLVATPVSSVTVASGSGIGVIGDVFTIGNVFRVHPETKVNTGELQQFVLTANTLSGAGTWSFSPAIVLAGAKQNVVIPTTSATAAITVNTASKNYDNGLVYHPDFATFVTADLDMPKGVDFAAREVMDGISMRIVQDYDITNDERPCRIDVLFGFKTLYPEWACRVGSRQDA